MKMSFDSQLLDTPKRASLQSQSVQIRAALKEFERTFATSNNGRKPSKDDIKADTVVAAKYKEYSRIRDVLEGKLDYAALIAPPKSPSKKRKHQRTDSGVSWATNKNLHATPRKSPLPNQLDPYDIINSASPKPALLHAIGPTPQRDGKVLGLFDLLSNSTSSLKATPSGRKRKLDALIEESPQKCETTLMAQTPSQRKQRDKGDLLDYLSGTPETNHRKHSRTPISEGRKFMLSQFFATPSTARFSDVGTKPGKEQKPLRDRILGLTPQSRGQIDGPSPDATPAYLRRSTSFKDRLLSASQSSVQIKLGTADPSVMHIGPPTLRHLRSVPRLFSGNEPGSYAAAEEEDEDEDDLEALRELGHYEVNALVKDSQQQPHDQHTNDTASISKDLQPLSKVWKKRGQKRTTRRVAMKPALGQLASAPKFVAASNPYDDHEARLHTDETQFGGQTVGVLDDDIDDFNDDANDDMSSTDEFETKQKSVKKAKGTKDKGTVSKEKSKKSATINPNATSHMNFRSLKIKNKNSKAKGRAKFGRGRR